MADYQKLLSEMNVNILNFIVDNLLDENNKTEDNNTEIFLDLIDNFCGINKESPYQQKNKKTEEGGDTFEEMNIDQLFKLCQANENNEKKSQITRKILPFLLSKCQEIIQNYLNEEKLYVGISCPRYFLFFFLLK